MLVILQKSIRTRVHVLHNRRLPLAESSFFAKMLRDMIEPQSSQCLGSSLSKASCTRNIILLIIRATNVSEEGFVS